MQVDPQMAALVTRTIASSFWTSIGLGTDLTDTWKGFPSQ